MSSAGHPSLSAWFAAPAAALPAVGTSERAHGKTGTGEAGFAQLLGKVARVQGEVRATDAAPGLDQAEASVEQLGQGGAIESDAGQAASPSPGKHPAARESTPRGSRTQTTDPTSAKAPSSSPSGQTSPLGAQSSHPDSAAASAGLALEAGATDAATVSTQRTGSDGQTQAPVREMGSPNATGSSTQPGAGEPKQGGRAPVDVATPAESPSPQRAASAETVPADPGARPDRATAPTTLTGANQTGKRSTAPARSAQAASPQPRQDTPTGFQAEHQELSPTTDASAPGDSEPGRMTSEDAWPDSEAVVGAGGNAGSEVSPAAAEDKLVTVESSTFSLPRSTGKAVTQTAAPNDPRPAPARGLPLAASAAVHAYARVTETVALDGTSSPSEDRLASAVHARAAVDTDPQAVSRRYGRASAGLATNLRAQQGASPTTPSGYATTPARSHLPHSPTDALQGGTKTATKTAVQTAAQGPAQNAGQRTSQSPQAGAHGELPVSASDGISDDLHIPQDLIGGGDAQVDVQDGKSPFVSSAPATSHPTESPARQIPRWRVPHQVTPAIAADQPAAGALAESSGSEHSAAAVAPAPASTAPSSTVLPSTPAVTRAASSTTTPPEGTKRRHGGRSSSATAVPAQPATDPAQTPATSTSQARGSARPGLAPNVPRPPSSPTSASTQSSSAKDGSASSTSATASTSSTQSTSTSPDPEAEPAPAKPPTEPRPRSEALPAPRPSRIDEAAPAKPSTAAPPKTGIQPLQAQVTPSPQGAGQNADTTAMAAPAGTGRPAPSEPPRTVRSTGRPNAEAKPASQTEPSPAPTQSIPTETAHTAPVAQGKTAAPVDAPHGEALGRTRVRQKRATSHDEAASDATPATAPPPSTQQAAAAPTTTPGPTGDAASRHSTPDHALRAPRAEAQTQTRPATEPTASTAQPSAPTVHAPVQPAPMPAQQVPQAVPFPAASNPVTGPLSHPSVASLGPGSPAASEPASLYRQAAEDPGLGVTVLPHAAHLSLASDAGDLSLHVRVRDGNADVNVSGSMAPLFESKAPEVRTVLAGQGLALGSFATDQQGGQSQSQQHAEHVPVEPAQPHSTVLRRGTSPVENAVTDQGRIHITA